MTRFIRLWPTLNTFRLVALTLMFGGAVGMAQERASSAVRATSEALRRQDYDDALKTSAAGLKVAPADVRLVTLRGMAFAGKHDWTPALSSFHRALKLSPDYLPALEGAAQLAFQQNDPRAGSLLKRILVSHPDEPTANAMLGSLAYKANDCKNAVQHFERAQAALATQAEGLMQYGACLGSLNRSSDAVPVLEQAVQLAPESHVTRFNLALAQFNAGRADAALNSLELLVSQPVPDEDVLTLAAEIAESKNDTQKAVELLRRAIVAHPKERGAYLQFAYLSYKHSSVQVGIDIVNVGIGQLPREPELYVARGVLLSQTPDIGRAIEDFDTAAKLNPNLSFAQAAQGIARSQTHDSGAALASFRTAAKEHPDDSLTQYLLAEELSNEAPEPGTTAFREGVAAARRSIMLDPKRAEAHDLLAALYLRSGEVDKSIEESEAALVLDPNDEQALYHQILALRKSDRKKEVPALVERMMKVRQAKAADKPKIYRLVEARPEQPKP
jgi:tetratricopeptide (TPR) repeat protein